MPKCCKKNCLKIHALSQPLWTKKIVFPATFFILQPWLRAQLGGQLRQQLAVGLAGGLERRLVSWKLARRPPCQLAGGMP